jgi:hypothetical protein
LTIGLVKRSVDGLEFVVLVFAHGARVLILAIDIARAAAPLASRFAGSFEYEGGGGVRLMGGR